MHKPIISKFEKRKVYSYFKDNYLGTEFANMQLISKDKKEFCFLLFFIDIYRKYVWVVPLKDKKDIPIINAFQRIFHESNCKPNKI